MTKVSRYQEKARMGIVPHTYNKDRMGGVPRHIRGRFTHMDIPMLAKRVRNSHTFTENSCFTNIFKQQGHSIFLHKDGRITTCSQGS